RSKRASTRSPRRSLMRRCGAITGRVSAPVSHRSSPRRRNSAARVTPTGPSRPAGATRPAAPTNTRRAPHGRPPGRGATRAARGAARGAVNGGDGTMVPRREALILQAALNPPWLLHDLLEELASLEFRHADAERLKAALIDIAAHASALEPGALRAELAGRNL